MQTDITRSTVTEGANFSVYQGYVGFRTQMYSAPAVDLSYYCSVFARNRHEWLSDLSWLVTDGQSDETLRYSVW